MNLLVMVPTYNEAENIDPFLKALFAALPPEGQVLVVDDNSPDGTAGIAEALRSSYPGRLHLLNRPKKQGLAAAYLAAFAWGLSRDFDVFLEMDADFSHRPEYVPVMAEAIGSYDVVIGSRNIRGGRVEGWSKTRNFISKGGSLYSRLVLGCPIRDLTGGFNMWRKSALEKIGLESIISRGYSFQVEMKYRAFRAGCSIKEIPIIFPDRTAGRSKMSKKIFLEALVKVWKIRWTSGRDTGVDQFVKFALTGGLGTVTNLALFFLAADLAKLPEIPVSIGCFMVAGTQNYLINHLWSFRKYTGKTPPSIRKWALFIGSSSLGLGVNILVMTSLLARVNLPFKFIAQGCGILAGMVINFILSKLVVFRKRSA
ncbi:MAG: glycosyltransferase family 2 protein [Spirochaetaceae bacterium]|jgi:dolichol-phosphate mannosyltransferase|nr:glycosyltransferase family 2 protein [Spirochaetaceae bacterium]